MGAILKNGDIFLHIPKTGGNWIFDLIEAKNNIKYVFKYKHSGLERVQLSLNEPFETKPFVFCFVRNPFKWYESWFKYQNSRDWMEWGRGDRFHHPCAIIDDCANSEFTKFMEKILRKVPGFLTGMYHRYTEYADFIGKQETLAEDFLRLSTLRKLNYTSKEIFNYPRVNEGKKTRIKWETDIRKELMKTEYALFKRYEYL